MSRMTAVEEVPVVTVMPRVGRAVRETEPAHYIPNAKGGLAFIPRRGVELGGYVTTKQAMMRFAQDTPLRLLTYLPDVHPTFGLALWNALRLSCKPSDLKIVAVHPKGTPNADEEDDNGTAEIEALWDAQPPESGGLNGLQITGTISALLTGLPFYEAVPGASGTGLWRVYPVDSLTLRMNREGIEEDIIVYQLQRYPHAGKTGGYVPLDPNRMFWTPVDAMPDDPYGRAPYSTALGECLRDLAMMQDITEAVHSTGYPRYGIPFNFKEMFEVAKLYGINDPMEAQNWVQSQFQATVDAFNKLNPGEHIHHDSSNAINVLESGQAFDSLTKLLEFLQGRIVQSVKSLPTLMGINSGSTQTYTTVEWQIYASGLESIRAIVCKLLEQIATLHLRLLGLPLVAKAIYTPIRTTDEILEAQAEAARIFNAERKRDNGWITQDQAAQEITGTDAVSEPNYSALGKNAGHQNNPLGKTGNGEKTQEENNAKKNRTEQN